MIKILKTFFLLSACIGLPVVASTVVEETISIGKANHISIESKALGETRSLLVHLPDNYTKSNQSYPVLYLIDGNRHLNHAVVSTQLLQSQKRIPEQIIVAILNNDKMHHDPDMAISKFTHFVKNEVMPYVNNKYKTSGLNTLFGHTKAGWFTADVLANHPDLFRNYIFASAPLQDDEVDIYNKILLNGERENAHEKSLYFAISSEADEPNRYSDSFNNLVSLLTTNSPKNLDWRYEHLTEQTHMTTSIPALYNGLTHVFNSYQAPSFANVKEYFDFGGMQGVEAHYKTRGKLYGTTAQIPENTLLKLATMLLNESEYKKSLELYLALLDDFPESAAAFSGLGQVYYSLKQYEKSIASHKMAVELAKKLNPVWQQNLFQDRLDRAKKERNG
ncbi:MAG: alpha/beta hydrolase-fold protein [Colwellia sp.]|nr:alpha/beta hydrolase-fold protein [Colwellia sp.]MCW8863244.1 alpha/beta hydrolase-fold protein [Colwellia sp.]MCW9081625.1 alpha/beta hydrolase-fold protein [Colwellia sp.]